MSPSAKPALGLAQHLGRNVALVILLLLCTIGTIRHETFLTPDNLRNVLRQNSMVGLMTLGMLFAMLSGGIDLSLGAMLAVGGVVAAVLSPYGTVAAVGGALLATALLGTINGLLIAWAGIQPFIATLAMNMAARGLLLHWTVEESVRLARGTDGLRWLGRGWLGPIPAPVVIFLLAYALAGFVLTHTRFGRHVHAVGDNAEAARLLGLNGGGVRVAVYAVSAALAGLGGVLLTGRVGLGQPTAGLGWELTAITAVILGNAAAGGRAGPFATLVSLLILVLLFNLFNLEGSINSYWQGVLRGVFLLLVVMGQDRLRRFRDHHPAAQEPS